MSKKTPSRVTKKASKKAGTPARGRSTPAKGLPANRTGTPTRRTSARAPAKAASRRSASGAPKARTGRAPAPAADAVSRRAASLVRFAHKMLDDMAGRIADDRATAQLAGACNHKLWTLGHLADANQWFASLIDGQAMTLPAEWSRLFGMGSTPEDNASIYPPIGDVRAAFEASVDRLCAAIEAHSDADLDAPPAGDGAGFVHDKLDSALKAMWHYGWHLGQVAALRKGLDPAPPPRA